MSKDEVGKNNWPTVLNDKSMKDGEQNCDICNKGTYKKTDRFIENNGEESGT